MNSEERQSSLEFSARFDRDARQKWFPNPKSSRFDLQLPSVCLVVPQLDVEFPLIRLR